MAYLGRQPNTGVRSRYIFTATASQTTFSGSDDDGKTLKYEDAAYLDVFLNGVLLKPTTDYAATTKTSVVLTSGAAASDIVEIVAYDIANIADTVSKANGGTFDAGVTVNGTVTSTGSTVNGDLTANNSTVSGTLTVGDGHTIGDDGGDNLKITSSTGESIVSESATGIHTWRDPSGEFGRFDASGNFMVAKTSLGVSNYGFAARADTGGTVEIARDDGTVLYVNRGTSDGESISIRKSNAVVGRIGVLGGGMFIGDSDVGIEMDGATNAVRPCNTNTPAVSDNYLSFGTSSSRWKDIYAVDTSINTSDQTEKQQIASLTDAEIVAAKALSKLFKTFKWNSAVETKGDAARTHTGHIAQEVQQAMTDAGLDAGNYAFFISSTWWETQTEVPAVEADEENGIEAKEAYTRTDTYATAEEAPEGATERTRLGIRYPELLAFIGAATEQRLTSIEARLATLENA